MFTHSDFCSPTTMMASKGSNARKDKEVGDSKIEKERRGGPVKGCSSILRSYTNKRSIGQ